MKLLGRNILYIEAVLAIVVAIYAALRWPELPLVNRMVCLFFVALVMHVWEESRYPGGFNEMVAEKLHFVGKDLHFGELITGSLVIVVGLVPILLPHVIWLSMAVMILGLLESVVHLSTVKIYDIVHYIDLAKGTRGLVIDIRNYPSEFVVFALGSLLVREHTPFASFTNADLSNPGAFHSGDTIGLDPGTTHYDVKVVILVDELSVS